MVETATLTGYTVSSSTCASLASTPTLQGHNSPDNKHTRWTLRPLSHFVFPEQPTVLPFLPPNYMPFARPDSSAGKESACSAGDLGSSPGLGRALEKGKATHSRILAWRTPWTIQSYSSYFLLFLLYTLLGTFHPLSQLQKSCPYWWYTNPCLQFKSLHWAPDLDILQESQFQHTHNGIVSFSLCSYYGNKSIHPSCPRQGRFSLAHVHKYTHPSHLQAYLASAVGLLLCLLVSYQCRLWSPVT